MNYKILLFLIMAVSPLISIAAPLPESEKPIRIITNNWSSQIVLSYILGGLYQKMGYSVEYVEKEISTQWGGIHRGSEHIQVEVWEGTMQEAFYRISKYGQMVDMGSHDAITREEWWYPSYVEDVCPGLPDWKALKKCAALFATDKTAPKGRYLAGPWEKPEKARIRALELDFEVEVAKTADDLWIELEKAYKHRKPIVLFNWTPNWVDVRYEGKFIEFPVHTAECETNPEWGVNKKWTFDCGNPPSGWLKKAAWVGMKERWPCAWGVLQNMNFTNIMIGTVAAMADKDGMSHQQAAQKWLSENAKVWSSWLPKQCSLPMK
ncbi:MAG: ABC transporter substrate-binding protein [Magnetococcales bacterium]|nr:ABC transporter substrate-binding protein [Magnetococcales bacterium]